MVWERVGDSSCNRRLDLSSGSVGGVVARQLFDEMPDHQDATTGGVLRITVSHVLYPVTKEVLHQILEVYGVEKMSVFERVNHVEAMVQLRSWQEAKQARDAFHGRCIYEGCCFLDILLVQPTPDSASSTMARCDAEASAIAPEVIVAGARSSPSDNGQDHVDTSIADSEVPVGDNSIKQATPDVTEHEVISGDQDGMDVSTANERCERGAGAAKSGIRVDYSNGEQTTAIAVKLVEQEVAAEEQDARDCLLTNGNAGPCEAAEVFNVQGKEGSKVRFGAVSYNMVLDALGRNGRLDDTLQLFNRMSREHEPPSKIAVNLGSFNVMVDAYCRAERFRDAIEVMGKMGEKRCAPDALSYNSLIDWLGKNKLVGEVEGLYKGWGSTDLSLSWCKDHMNDLVISLAHKVTKLQVLSLRQIKPQLEDNAVEAVANYCHDLRELDLSRSFGLSNRSLYALAHGCLHLTRLNISGCSNFSDAALTYLTSQCKNLKCLNLCGCVRVASDRALQAIACNCGQLQSLNLGWCDSITDKGVTSLASGCPELRAVDLCGCVNPDEYAYVLLVESGFKVHAIPLDGDDDAIEEILDPDFGEAAIGRVAPVDSGLEWIILLRAYGKCSGNLSVQDTYTPTSSDKVQLNCSILVSPSILPGTGHHVQIHTFGFGADHDSAAMHAIAETSSGTFSYIDAEGSIQDGFAQCIGGLLSVVVKETRLGIECVDEGVLLTSIKSGSYASQVAGNERSVSVDIGDLYADESEVAPSNRFEYHAVTEVIKEVEFKEVDGGAASASEKLNALPIFCQQEIQKQSVAWLIGWALILEYTIGGSSVARGISPDLALFFGGQDKFPFFIAQVHLKWLDTPVDPCAAILVMLVTALLCLGIKESSFVEGIITIANVAVMLFVICAGGWLGFQNGWAGYNVPKGYFPNGVSGVFSGSATLFFAYIGFDAVASTAEEVKNPQRDLPWGMGLTLSLCCILYMMISVIIVGLVPYYAMDPDTPISSAFAQYGMQWAVYVVSSGAVLALIASLIGAILPQPRIVMAMARDGLLPPLFSAVDQQTQVPTLSTILTGICAAILAFFMDVSQLAGMVSVGTLLAFTMVAISVLVVRYAPPNEMPMKVVLPSSPESLTSHSGHSSTAEENLEDPFGNVQEAPTGSEVANKVRRQKATRYIVLICVGIIIFMSAVSLSFLPFYLQSTACAIGGLLLLSATIVLSCIGQDKRSSRQTGGFMCPFVPVLPICCILINVYLLMNLGSRTWISVSIWLAAGALIYIFYGRKHSSLTGTAYQRISPA